MIMLGMGLAFMLNAAHGQGAFLAVARACTASDTGTFAYQRLRITRPKDNSAFWNTAGDVVIRVQVSPPLCRERGDRIRIYLDGKLAGAGSELRVTDVVRGTHELYAEVVDRHGGRLLSSPVVHFTLHRHSILLPR
ncbi:MAG: hypothetical protein P8079_05535 [Gammaproteobacteria bacterium]|jgi:hypothetical protein